MNSSIALPVSAKQTKHGNQATPEWNFFHVFWERASPTDVHSTSRKLIKVWPHSRYFSTRGPIIFPFTKKLENKTFLGTTTQKILQEHGKHTRICCRRSRQRYETTTHGSPTNTEWFGAVAASIVVVVVVNNIGSNAHISTSISCRSGRPTNPPKSRPGYPTRPLPSGRSTAGRTRPKHGFPRRRPNRGWKSARREWEALRKRKKLPEISTLHYLFPSSAKSWRVYLTAAE